MAWLRWRACSDHVAGGQSRRQMPCVVFSFHAGLLRLNGATGWRTMQTTPVVPQTHFRGVSWHRGKWMSRATVEGKCVYIGVFNESHDAAKAYDETLRRMIRMDAFCAMRLNFPTDQEAALISILCPDETRKKHMHSYAGNSAKEASAKVLIQTQLRGTPYELRWLPEGTKADGIFRVKQDPAVDAWVGVQVKSTAQRLDGAAKFGSTKGYDGLVLLCVSLVSRLLWVIPGRDVKVNRLTISLSGKWHVYHCCWLALPQMMASIWQDPISYPRHSEQMWRQPSNPKQKFALLAHDLTKGIFAKAGISLSEPLIEHGPVDAILDGDIRAQLKATSAPRGTANAYRIPLQRRNGRGAFRQYTIDEFDTLIVQIMGHGVLLGLFVIPMCRLHDLGLIGAHAHGSGFVCYPHWSTPTYGNALRTKAWQAQYFVPVLRDMSNDDANRLRSLVHDCRRRSSNYSRDHELHSHWQVLHTAEQK